MRQHAELMGEEQTPVWLRLAVSPLVGSLLFIHVKDGGLELRIFKASPNASTSILQLQPLA